MKIMKVKGPKSSLDYHPGSSPSLDTEYTEWKVVASLPPPSYGISSGLKTISQVGVTPPWGCCWACIVWGRCLARETPHIHPRIVKKHRGSDPAPKFTESNSQRLRLKRKYHKHPRCFWCIALDKRPGLMRKIRQFEWGYLGSSHISAKHYSHGSE